MNSDLILYVLAIVLVVTAFLVVKKVASCLVKTVILLIVLAVLGFLYYAYAT